MIDELKKALSLAAVSPAVLVAAFAAAPLVAVTAGCDSEAENATDEAADEVRDATEAQADQVEEAGEARADQMEEAADAQADRVDATVDNAADVADDAADTADDAMGANPAAQAETMFGQIEDHIEKRDFPAAEAAMTRLEGMRASLPAALQARIDQVRTALNTAKAAAGNLPGMTP